MCVLPKHYSKIMVYSWYIETFVKPKRSTQSLVASCRVILQSLGNPREKYVGRGYTPPPTYTPQVAGRNPLVPRRPTEKYVGKRKLKKASQFVSVARKKTLSGEEKKAQSVSSQCDCLVYCKHLRKKEVRGPQRVASRGWCACERESSKGFSVGRGRSEEKFLRFGDCLGEESSIGFISAD